MLSVISLVITRRIARDLVKCVRRILWHWVLRGLGGYSYSFIRGGGYSDLKGSG